ncbi:MAG: MATE family efflux transporter [Agarilytica sp.]
MDTSSSETRNTKPSPNNQPTQTQDERSKALSSAPIGKLYLHMALPMAFGLLLHGLYNIVDAYFVTRYVGANAIAGVSIAFPIQMIIHAFGAMIGAGASTLVSQKLGAKDTGGARNIAANAISLCLIAAAIFTTTILWLFPQLLKLMNTSDAHIPYVQAYLTPLIFGTVLFFAGNLCSDLLRSEGRIKPMMLITIIAAIGNILLDALLIVHFNFGVSGAAWATLIAQAISVTTGIALFCNPSTALKISSIKLKVATSTYKRILALGVPLLLSFLGTSLTFGFINASLAGSAHPESELMVSAYGVLGRAYIFIVLPLLAIANTTQTLVAFNYGAKRLDRVKRTAQVGAYIAFAYLLTFVALTITMSDRMMMIFTENMALVRIGSEIAQIYFIGLPLAAINMVILATFQGLGRPKEAMVLSLFRTYGLLLSLIVIIPKIWTIKHIWFAAPVSEVIAITVISAVIYVNKTKIFSVRE